MDKPKLTEEQLVRAVKTGKTTDYLAAHSEMAPVYSLEGNEPRYDVLLDAEASDELYRQFSGGKGSLQTASREELQAYCEATADKLWPSAHSRRHRLQQDRHRFDASAQEQALQNPWIGFLIRAAIIISATIIFVVVVTLAGIYYSHK